jgi:DNA-binding FadR family transcriptional regulator
VTAAASSEAHGPRPSAGDHSKLAAQTARRIEDDIVAAGWPVGEVIGSEADLMERYDISRAVLREAVRLVEHHGVARMRRGPAGGLVVQAPDAAAAVSAVVLYLEHVDPSVADLLFARRILEPLAAAMAAERVTEDGIEQLRTVLDAERAGGDRQMLSTDHNVLHLTIASLAGNATLALFVEILAELTAHYATARSRVSRDDAARGARAVSRAHSAMANAIIAGDAAAAQHRADVHLAAIEEFLTLRRRDRSSSGGAGANGSHDKLAEVIARRIRWDIADEGLEVGDVIGSETDLLERYGFSRAVLREAVRLLEHHSVAAMRRGPGGGLIVAQPDPAAIVETVALYLEYRGAQAEELRAVRDAMELGVVDLLADKANDELVMQQLRDALLVDESTDFRAVSEPAHYLHVVMADLAGNPVLALLLRISLSLWHRHTHKADRTMPVPPEQISATVAKVHRAIVDAVASGDHGVARHRMRRHLTALTEWWE